MRPLLVGLSAALYYAWRTPRVEAEADSAWVTRLLHLGTPVVLVVLVGATLVAGIRYGTFAAEGSDAYGYLSQARLWAAGTLRVEQPWMNEMSWPDRDWSFTPLGYRPGARAGTIVPTYPAGLPMLMAAFERLFGPNGPFYVIPLFGALAVWWTYALAKAATRRPSAGILAAALLAASPVFLAHLMLPMTDVAVAAGWTLVWLLAFRNPRPLAAGLAAGATLLIRPNLLLLAMAPVAAWTWPCLRRRAPWRDCLRASLAFGVGVAPGLLIVAAIHEYLYGSPLASGYGGLQELYALSVAPANIRQYGSWLLESQTVLVALAVQPFVVATALRQDEQQVSIRVGFMAVLALVALSYAFYGPFEHWFYLRFLLPAFPIVFILMAAAIRDISGRLASPLRVPVAGLLLVACAGSSLKFAVDQEVFAQHAVERRYIDAARRVADRTPSNAVIMSVQHSGSVRYYAGRITLRYDWLPPESLDRTIDELNAKGYRPYILLDDWEEPGFRATFAGLNAAGKLDWHPIAEIPGRVRVRLYDPADRGRAGRASEGRR